MRSGTVRVDNGHLRVAGLYAIYWASSAFTDKNGAYRLYFSGSGLDRFDVDSLSDDDRYQGYSLRCLQE